LDFVPSTLTVLAVLLPILDVDFPIPVVIGLTILCVSSWMMIAVDIRRPVRRTIPKLQQLRERV
jgi:hypothetical protein